MDARDFEQILEKMRETLLVTDTIQRRHDRFLQDHQEWLVA